jgi:hypothetical protein
MASRSDSVILGVSRPLVAELISSIDDPAGAAPVLLTATCTWVNIMHDRGTNSVENLIAFIKSAGKAFSALIACHFYL